MSSSTIDTLSLPSEALDMGNTVAEYRSRTVKQGTLAIAGGIFAALLLVVGLAAGYDMLAVLGGLFMAAAAWRIIGAIRIRDQRIVVLEKGLVRFDGRKTEIIRWDEIANVFQAVTDHYVNGVKAETTHVYTVFVKGGRKVVFNDTFTNVEALGATIQSEAMSRLLPRYAQAYDSGKPVSFGRLTLSKAGISNGTETIPWDQVEAVNIKRGRISVRKQGKWLNWAGQTAAATPNLLIFLALVDQIVGINQKKH